ncbi:UNVERIFIED_CONTAM: hypothetical protein K2H54_053532 [Gekko kuhli]
MEKEEMENNQMCDWYESVSSVIELEVVKRVPQDFSHTKMTKLDKKKLNHGVKRTYKANKYLEMSLLKYKKKKLEMRIYKHKAKKSEIRIYKYKAKLGLWKYKWEKMEIRIHVYEDERHLDMTVKKKVQRENKG